MSSKKYMPKEGIASGNDVGNEFRKNQKRIGKSGEYRLKLPRICAIQGSVRDDQYFLFRAASAFFFRLTLGFS